MIKEYYTIKLQHLENMIKRWGKRGQTPIGKNTVIKTIMISAFNHLFLALPNPNQRVLDYINNILFSFLWNNKPSKIKKSVIIKPYCEGGLQMINWNAFIDALKSTWIRRLFINNCKWQNLLKSEIEIDKLSGCNIKYAENIITNIQNKFWKDMLQSFININNIKLVNEDMVLQSRMFYNENIKIGGSHIFYNTWYKKRIRFLNDLINERGEFYTHEEFKEMIGMNSNTFQYHGTIKAIKVYLKDIKLNITHKMN